MSVDPDRDPDIIGPICEDDEHCSDYDAGWSCCHCGSHP